jgi:diamine N-acetyltransferase
MLEGQSLILRALELNDIELLYSWENNEDVWKVSHSITPVSKYLLEQYVLSAHLDIYTAKQLRLMICKKENGQSIGCIDLFDFDPQHRRAGVGILIGEKNERGKGYAQESLLLLKAYAFKTLNLHQLFCNITHDNKASLDLFIKNNFEIIGTKKQWIMHQEEWLDELMLQLIRK